MRYFLIASMSALLAACGSSEPPLAGDLTEKDICQTSGYLIRQQLGDSYKTINQSCTVKKEAGGSIVVSSGYETPFGSTRRYQAKGFVSGTKLQLDEIKVTGIDEEYVPFGSLGG